MCYTLHTTSSILFLFRSEGGHPITQISYMLAGVLNRVALYRVTFYQLVSEATVEHS